MHVKPGERIKIWREHIGLSQVDLAERAKMEKSKLCRIESGELQVRVEDLETIVEAMGLTMPKVYGRLPRTKAS